MRMNRLILACLSTIAFLSLPAMAELINGDFEQPLTVGWSAVPGTTGLSERLAGYADNATSVAHLNSTADFTFADGSWVGVSQQAGLRQFVTVEPGQTTLAFDAIYGASGLEVGNAVVQYSCFTGGAGTVEVTPSLSWGTYELPLLDADDQPLAVGTRYMLTIMVEAKSPRSNGQEGQQVSQVAEGYFDNFRFVPEPCSLLLILAGLPLLRRK